VTTIQDDENFQGTFRILGIPWPNQSSEATNKLYVDTQIQQVIDSGTGETGIGNIFLLMGG
jgi:hypothetical protein